MMQAVRNWMDRLRSARDALWQQGIRYAPSIQGRATRTELFVTLALVAMAFALLWPLAARLTGTPGKVLQAGLVLVLSLPLGSALVRRLHDSGRSAWALWLCIIPYASIWVVAYSLWNGTQGPNDYGPDPRQRR